MLFGINSTAVVVGALSSAVVIDMTIRLFFWRTNRKKLKRLEFEIEEMRFELRKLQEEVSLLKQAHITSVENNAVPKIFLNHLNAQASNDSPSSTSEYLDAMDDWSQGNEVDDHIDRNGAASVPYSGVIGDMIQLEKIDRLHEENDGEQCYALLKKIYDSDPSAKENIEVLWRLARACHSRANGLQQKDPKKKELILEGQQYALAAHKINDNDFNVLKWCAATTGSLTGFLGTKEKIQQGYQFKEYLDKAIALKSEYSLFHMRGRFSYDVANLSWLERKAASTFFATPPTATIDEALEDFLEVEKLRPNQWIENLLYIARCYISKSDKANTVKYLKLAAAIEAQDDADKEALVEVNQLLAKHGK